MCFQITEQYSACRCLYYQHPVDRCAYYGRSGHHLTKRTILVGYTCSEHIRSVPVASPAHAISRRRKDANIPGRAPPQSEVNNSKPKNADTNPNLASRQDRNKERGPATADSRNEETANDDSDDGSDFDWNDLPEIDFDAEVDQDNESDSGGLDLSEGESVISTTSAATTVDIDSLEAIFRRLLHYGELRFLWPQVVRRSLSRQRCLRNIERFLRRYAEDLQNLATSNDSKDASSIPAEQVRAHIAASRFVRRSRLNLAQRILQAYDGVCQVDGPIDDSAERGCERPASGAVLDESDNDDPVDFMYTVAEAFLFETDPILYLQANVKAFVKLPRLKRVAETLGDSIKLLFENTVLKLGRPPILEGKKRITWTCVRITSSHFRHLGASTAATCAARLTGCS